MFKPAPTGLDQIPEFLNQDDQTIKKAMKISNKILAIRLFDLYIKKLSRQISETQLRIEVLTPFITPEERQKQITHLLTLDINKHERSLERLSTTAQPLEQKLVQGLKDGVKFLSSYKNTLTILAEHKAQLEILVRRAKIARQAIPTLDASEQSKLYPSMASLYEEQANRRAWYHHGAFVFTLGILLLPISPLIYHYLWKQPRDKEIIQPNPFNSLQLRMIRSTRKIFKEETHELPDPDISNRFMRKDCDYDKQYPSRSNKLSTPYITKYKKQRNAFFLENTSRFFGTIKKAVTSQEAEYILNSKNEDEMLYLNHGMKH
ncbi:MAG: hypothetical protein WC627_08525 [Legionella sp.]|jgi:hypothetical protein